MRAQGDIADLMTALILILAIGTPLNVIAFRIRRRVRVAPSYFEYEIQTGHLIERCRLQFLQWTDISWFRTWEKNPLFFINQTSKRAWYLERTDMPIDHEEWALMVAAFERFAPVLMENGRRSTWRKSMKEWDFPAGWLVREVLNDVCVVGSGDVVEKPRGSVNDGAST
jgi:hypothetical protein